MEETRRLQSAAGVHLPKLQREKEASLRICIQYDSSYIRFKNTQRETGLVRDPFVSGKSEREAGG